MTIHRQNFRGVSALGIRADATDAAALINQFKATFEAFKAENDKQLAAVKAKVDPLDVAKLDKMNADLTALTDEINKLNERNAALELNGSGNAADRIKAAADFSKATGTTVTPEQLDSYSSALDTYMRFGANSRQFSEVRAAMEVGNDPAGGYTVTPDMTGRIVTKIFETSPIRQLASTVTIGTDALEGFFDRDEAVSGWVGEKQTRTETATPELGKYRIDVHEQYAMPKVTQKLLDDSSFAIEQWLAAKVADKFARTENAACFTGDGVLKPRGLLTYSTAATADATRAWQVFQHTLSGGNTSITNSDFLIDLVMSLKAGYRANANWGMNRNTVALVRKLKDGDGNYLWQPDFTQRQGGNLLGYGIVECEDMPDVGANALSIAFGDFAETYTIVDRVGIRVLRDAITEKGFLKLYTTKRMGGDVLNFDSMKFMKFSA